MLKRLLVVEMLDCLNYDFCDFLTDYEIHFI